MPVLAPPPPVNQDINTRQYKDWFYTIYQSVSGAGGDLGTMATQNANNVAITGGVIGGVGITGSTINNTPIGQLTPALVSSTGGALNGSIGVTTPNSGYFTTSLYRNGYTVKPNCFIEAYDLSTGIALTATPTLLRPASTGGSSGITYDSSTGVFTFSQEGDYSLSLVVNALSSASNQYVYIYAEKNTGSGWSPITNSGKYYLLQNSIQTQVIYSQSLHRAANEQTRYYIYSNSNKVTLDTITLPSVTPSVYVPAIRIQYS